MEWVKYCWFVLICEEFINNIRLIQFGPIPNIFEAVYRFIHGDFNPVRVISRHFIIRIVDKRHSHTPPSWYPSHTTVRQRRRNDSWPLSANPTRTETGYVSACARRARFVVSAFTFYSALKLMRSHIFVSPTHTHACVDAENLQHKERASACRKLNAAEQTYII